MGRESADKLNSGRLFGGEEEHADIVGGSPQTLAI
jgi:hypothetical protein